MTTARVLLLGVLLVSACGGSGAVADDDAPIDAAIDAGVDPDGFISLLEGDWNLGPGQEGYFCVYATVPRDIYLKALRPISPLGTHHTVLTRYASTSPADGVVPCNVGTNGQNMIFGSGVGAPDFAFPAGVGLHLAKGQRLLLNLHLFNASDQPLAGRSGTKFLETTAADVPNLAEMVLAGPTITLNIPNGTSTQSGTCQLNNITSTPIQTFALSQHMHKLGTNMKSVVTRGGTQIVLQDIPYDFEQQSFHLTPSLVELRPGDVLTTNCSYNNTTGHTVTFGESSNDEMCFTDLFYYPAQQANFICSN